MYSSGQVQTQNLWATLKAAILSTSNPQNKAYWTYIASQDADGMFQSTDGNNILLRMSNLGIGWGISLGVYDAYTPGAAGSPGSFGAGDWQNIYYISTGLMNGGASYYPGPVDPSIGSGGIGVGYTSGQGANAAGGIMPAGLMNTSYTKLTTNQLAATALVNYWIVVTPTYVTIVLQGDPVYSNSITQFGSAGLLNRWTNESGHGASYVVATQYKQYGLATMGVKSVMVLKNRAGQWGQPYNTFTPRYTFSVYPNVWTGAMQMSPISVYVDNEGYRGDVPGLAVVAQNGSLSGDEFTATNPDGSTSTWKHFVTTATTSFAYDQQMTPDYSIVILEDNN